MAKGFSIRKFFPWKLFRRAVYAQIAGFLFVMLVSVFVGYFFLLPDLDPASREVFKDNLRQWFVRLGPLSLLYIFIMALWLSYRGVAPLTYIIFKARKLASRKWMKAQGEIEDLSIYEEEVEEFYELEVALQRIERKMKKRKGQLEQIRDENEALMSGIADAVVAVDRGENILFYNSQFATRFVGQEIGGAQSRRFSEFCRQPGILDGLSTALSRSTSQEVKVELYSSLENRSRIYSVAFSPLRRKGQEEIYGALLVFHDITDLKTTEKIRIDFVSNASHELRTPLTAVKGYVDTLKEDLAAGRSDTSVQFVDIIQRNVNRLTDLTNDLLILSRVESNGELQMEMIDVQMLTSQIVEQLNREVASKGHSLYTDSQIGDFYGDPLKVGQVLSNLISNAIRYTPNGGKIEVRWEKSSEGDVYLHVRNNGPGIAPEHLPRLFERFYRVDKSRSREVGGTGLGLAIVKHIMQVHGGWVKVKSEVGKGTEFTCCFPYREEA